MPDARVVEAKTISTRRGAAIRRSSDPVQDAVSLLQAIADPVRWTVLNRLAQRPSCVCDLQEHVPIAANLLSYHLKVLREAGLVSSSRRGRWIDYALTPDAWTRITAALPITSDEVVS